MSPTSAVAAAYRRLATGQPAAWISLVPEAEAMEAARRLEADGPEGHPLWGLPFAVKDNIDVAGMRTTAGCPAFGYVAAATAPAVQRLLAAGAVLIGKTNLDQFATGLVGTRSPYGTCHSVLDPTLISGGSSSGSAVAVAEGVVAFSLGTDTAGSGRVPAAANAIVGLKPTRNLVSTTGVVPACRSLDCVSVFARSVDEAAAVLAVVADPAPHPLPVRPRIGVPPRSSWELGALQTEAYSQAISSLPPWAEVVEVDLTPLLAAGELLYGGALVAERLTVVGPLLDRDPDAVHPVVRAVVEQGRRHSAADLFRDQHRIADLAAQLATVWSDVDALLCPTVPDIPTIAAVDADPIDANAALGRWTNGVNLLDLCGITVPFGRPPGSVTVLGPAGSDALVTDLARRVAAPRVSLAVVGAHLSGLPLNHQLTDRGAYLERATRTAAAYRLYALATDPPKPGMVRTPGGASIEAEVWSLSEEAFGSFVAGVPQPLAIGTVDLADGTQVKGFLCEPSATTDALEITDLGSWRTYLARG